MLVTGFTVKTSMAASSRNYHCSTFKSSRFALPPLMPCEWRGEVDRGGSVSCGVALVQRMTLIADLPKQSWFRIGADKRLFANVFVRFRHWCGGKQTDCLPDALSDERYQSPSR